MIVRIIYVVTGLKMGGAEKVVVDLADQMSLRGHDVKLLYLKSGLVVRPSNFRVEVICLNFENLFNFYSALSFFLKIIKDFDPDVIHSHMIHANIFSRIARIFKNYKKLICTAHNSNEGGFLRMLAYRLTNFLSDLNTNVSNEATKALILKGAFDSNNLITVYNGVDLNKFSFSDKERKINFLSVGRLNLQKDYPNLLNAIKLIDDKINKNIVFNIAGDGELKFYLEKMISELNLNERVKLIGKRNDIPKLLQQSKFLVLSSKYEGLPTVIIEAMASGVYVISTDCGGCKEIMGETGMLVPIENSEALASKILEACLLSDEEIIQNNREARVRVEKTFSLPVSVDKWLELYGK